MSQNAVIYARVSSERQAEEGYSIEAQLDLLRDYAFKFDYKIAKEFIDVETAKSAGRTHFGRMLQFLSEHPDTKILIVEKTDRLYRNMRDYVDLDDLGLTIHLVKEGEVLSNSSTSSSKFMHRIKLVMAQHYCDNLTEEVKKGMNKKASLGEWPSKPPIGYIRDKHNNQLLPDPIRAPLIHRLFTEYSKGIYSLKSLTIFAKNIGLRSVNGKYVNKAGIHRIIKNIIYTGKYFLYKGRLFDNCIHDPIIPIDLYHESQNILNGGCTPKFSKRNFAFRGLLKCEFCGCSLTPDIKKEKYIYYRCTQYKGKCKNTVTEKKLADLFGNVLKKIQIGSDFSIALKASLRESYIDKEDFHKESIKTIRARYDRVRSYLEKAYEDRLDGVIEEPLWRKKSQEWNHELHEIDIQIASHQRANNDYLEMGNRIIEVANEAYDLYLSQSNHERRQLLNNIVSNCTYGDGSLCVTYKKPFNWFAEGSKTEKWRG